MGLRNQVRRFPIHFATLVASGVLFTTHPCLAQDSAAEPRKIIRGGREATVLEANGAGQSLQRREIYQRTLKGTVWLRNMKGNETTFGTGSLVDAEKRLVLTNHHVIEGFQGPIEVYFPVTKDGVLETDPDYYVRRIRPIHGRVIDSESQRDLALLQLDDVPETAEALTLAAESLVPGDEVYSIAGLPKGSSGLWIFTTGVVRQVYRRQALLENQLIDAVVVETQAPINSGNSGGPVVNDRGELAAVVSFGRSDANLVECFIDRSEVKDYLEVVTPLVDPKTSEHFATRGKRQFDEKRLDAALADFNKAIQLDPKNVAAYTGRGNTFLAQEDLQSALADFNEALELSPKSFEGLLGRGKTYRAQSEFDASLKDLTNALRNVTDDAEIYDVINERGITHYWKEEYRDAVADFTKAIEHLERKEKTAERVTVMLLRDKAQVYSNRGETLNANGEHAKALADLQRAISINPKDASFWSTLGAIRTALDQDDDAIACYSQAIALAPKDSAYLRSRAEILCDLDRLQEALADYVKAVELEPSNPENINLVGVALYRLKEYALASDAFRKAIAADTSVAMYHNNLGDAQFELGNYSEALKAYSTAIQYNDQNASFYSSRGQTYEAMGNPVAAKADYQMAAKIAPDTYTFHERRYLAVTNDATEPLKVFVQYHTLGTDGKWRWYPDGYATGTAVVFELAEGATWNLYHDEYRILSNRIKIWAVGKNTGDTWSGNKTEDCITAASCGYLSTEKTPGTYTYRFYE